MRMKTIYKEVHQLLDKISFKVILNKIIQIYLLAILIIITQIIM